MPSTMTRTGVLIPFKSGHDLNAKYVTTKPAKAVLIPFKSGHDLNAIEQLGVVSNARLNPF